MKLMEIVLMKLMTVLMSLMQCVLVVMLRHFLVAVGGPDCYSPSKFGGLAAYWNMDLVYLFIANPTTVLAAYYSKFQYLNYNLVADTIEDELPVSLVVRATKKDNLTWFEAQKSK